MSPPPKVVSKARNDRTHQRVAQLQRGAFSTPPTLTPPLNLAPLFGRPLCVTSPNGELACRLPPPPPLLPHDLDHPPL